MTYRVESVEERSVHSLHGLEEYSRPKGKKMQSKKNFSYCFKEATRLKFPPIRFYATPTIVLFTNARPHHATRTAETEPLIWVKALLSGHELNFPSPVTQSWLKQSRLSTGLVNDTLAKVRIVTYHCLFRIDA
ncbi:D-glycero-alpha-D-manno-heptose 7-phosphate kinase [Trichinella spiralis]|uniref:D-glycero-alpha-D-manno-heptose 7-phosphate kinase n=1 Tax=Trichinella spiralis TaxID=6334 RepID=A0ABR3K1G3_TRISP